MTHKTQVIAKIARIASIVYIAFISLFALDVFSADYTPLQILVGLFMHLIPSFIFIFATWIAWKNEKFGGSIFILLGIISIFFFHTYENFISFLIVTTPLLMIGGLFVYAEKTFRKLPTKKIL